MAALVEVVLHPDVQRQQAWSEVQFRHVLGVGRPLSDRVAHLRMGVVLQAPLLVAETPCLPFTRR